MGYIKDKESENIIFSNSPEEGEIIPIIADDDEESMLNTKLPNELPVLPLRNTVLFPGVVMPLTVGRQKSLKLVRDVYANDKLFGCVSQKDALSLIHI